MGRRRLLLLGIILIAATCGQGLLSDASFAKGKPGAPSLMYARDGSGTTTCSKTKARSNSVGNSIIFTYTVASGGMSNGIVTVSVPDGWSAPSAIGSDPGYTTSSVGTVVVSGRTVVVSGVTLPGGSTVQLIYGDLGAGGPGAAAPNTYGTQTWPVQQQSTPTGVLSDLSASPSILVAPLFAPFHTQGNAIKDVDGNAVVFRGIEREGETWDSFPTDDEIGRIRAWGANFVRVPLSESLWLNTCLSTSPSNDVNYPKKVDSLVGSITGRGMVALLELNFNVTQACGKSAAQAMADEAFSPTFWKQVATRYAANSLVAFDLYNEPHDVNDTQWLDGGAAVSGTTSFQIAGMQQLYNTVRAAGATNLVFAAGKNWAATPAGTTVSGTNIVYSVHVYSSDPNVVLNQWGAIGRTLPVMNTEFGSNNHGSDGAYNAAVIAACEQRGWGWNAYAFDGKTSGNYDLVADLTTYNPAPAGVPVQEGLALNG